jgi:hypothetical protein
MAGRGI